MSVHKMCVHTSQSLEFSDSKQRYIHVFVILFMLDFSILFLDICFEFDSEILGNTSCVKTHNFFCVF
jgi:hypothetical protein